MMWMDKYNISFTFTFSFGSVFQELVGVVGNRWYNTSPFNSSFQVYTIPWMFRTRLVLHQIQFFKFYFWHQYLKFINSYIY